QAAPQTAQRVAWKRRIIPPIKALRTDRYPLRYPLPSRGGSKPEGIRYTAGPSMGTLPQPMNKIPPPMNDHPTPVDLIVHARWIIPVEPAGSILEDHALLVRDGHIVSLLPDARARLVETAERLELGQQVLLPGLVNAHGHTAMSLLRGYADDQPLATWLNEHIWPAEAR